MLLFFVQFVESCFGKIWWWVKLFISESLEPILSLQVYDRLLITSWGHDPGVVPTSNVLTMLNDALTHSAVLIQVNSLRWGWFFYVIVLNLI